MTEMAGPKRTALGNVPIEKDISGVHITIGGEELTWKRAARQLRSLADLLEARTLDAKGFNWDYGGEFEMNVMLPDMFPHGDYQDAEGNLIHVANDHVTSVIWAKKGAKKEVLDDVSVVEWAQMRGPLTPAGGDEAEEHEHEH